MRTSIYYNLVNNKQYKAATGLNISEFEVLYETFKSFYIPKTANSYSLEKLPVLTDKKEALFFILHYYKSYPTLQNLGLYFGFSEFTASTYIEYIKPFLKDSLKSESVICSRLFKNQSEFNNIFENVDTIMTVRRCDRC